MNVKPIVLLISLFIIIMSSCSKENDWQASRDNIIGSWDGVANFQKTFEDGSLEVGTKTIRAVFFDEKNCLITQNTFLTAEFSWLYQPSPERISISRKLGGLFSGNMPSIFEIRTNTSNSQIWIGEYEELMIDPSTSNITSVVVTETWSLSR